MRKKRRNQHEWDYMGHSKDRKKQYGYCALCNQWHIDGGKPFKMKPSVYEEMLRTGEIVIL